MLNIKRIIITLKHIVRATFWLMLVVMCIAQGTWSNEQQGDNKQIMIADWRKQNALDEWKEKTFQGDSKYQVISKKGELVLRADTYNAASSLYKESVIDISKTPYLQWRWQVESTYQNINQRTKQQDDYPARIYVIHKHWLFPWQSKVLNYVWSNERQLSEPWFSPYTNNSIMIPLRTAKQVDGKWYQERVNIQQDFKHYFNLGIEQIDGIAVMSDSDNAGQQTSAYYGNI